MKRSVSHGRSFLTVRLQVLAVIAGLSVTLLAGCPGGLEGGPWPAVGASGGATGTGTGGSGTGTGGASPPGCDAVAMVFPSCVTAACHKPMGFFDPDLSAAGAAALKTKMVITSSGPCAGMTLVNPSNKAGSPILKRVEGTMCGTQMPSGMPPLPADQIACLADWVNAQ